MNGSTYLYYDGSNKFNTNSSGVQVNGNLNVTSSITATSGTHTFGDDVRIGSALYHNGDTDTYINFTTNTIDFVTGGSRQLHLDGATTYLYYNGSSKLHTTSGGVQVNGTATVTSSLTATSGTQTFGNDVRIGQYLYHNGDTNTYMAYGSDTIDFYTGGDRQLYMNGSTTYLYYNGSYKLHTTSSGVTITGTMTETSALALKENIEPITNSLSIIDGLQGVKYDWRDKEKFEDRRQIGLIAENVKEVIPEAEVDGTVSYTKLVGLLVEGIKDLNKEVTDLKAKING